MVFNRFPVKVLQRCRDSPAKEKNELRRNTCEPPAIFSFVIFMKGEFREKVEMPQAITNYNATTKNSTTFDICCIYFLNCISYLTGVFV